MLQDLRVAFRSFTRTPGFAVIAVITLALGIGANTAVFTLVDAILLRPLPFSEPDRLVSVSHLGRDGEDELLVSQGFYLLYDEHARSLESFGLNQAIAVNFVDAEGAARREEGQSITPSVFDVLRVSPQIGRLFTAADAEQGGDPVVILSDAFWKAQFGGDPSALDEVVSIDGLSRRVVGVMREGFAWPDGQTRFWVPMTINTTMRPLMPFGSNGVGRLAPGATVEGLERELNGIVDRLAELRPDAPMPVGFLREANLTAEAEPMKAATVSDVSRTLWTLLGMVGFVLLIACANVGNLLLVRADGRQRELALRRAIGARNRDVLRPYLAESLWLTSLGGALGVLLASLAVGITLHLAPEDLPRMSEVVVDGRVLIFTAGVSLLAALAFGLLPALKYARSDLSGLLKDGSRGTAGRERHRVRNVLVVAQVAMALMLLIGTGLMLRSLVALLAVEPGFDADGVVVAELTVPPAEMESPAQVNQFYRQLHDRLAAEPQVESVGAINGLPLSGQINLGGHDIEDHPTPPDALPPMAFSLIADVGYFETMRVPILEGRAFTTGDGASAYRAIVVSEAYADRWWPQGSAVGRRIRFGEDEWWEIVGVVGNVRNRGLQEDAEEVLYLPTELATAEQPAVVRSRDLVIRVTGSTASFLPVLNRTVAELNPRIPLSQARTMASVVQDSASAVSFAMVILGAASVIALLLGMIGIYGVVSYVVSQRTREIGVRMAMGASAGRVRQLVVRQGMTLALVGVAVGLAGALAGSRVLTSLLYGVAPTDALTYASVSLLFAGVAAVASWIPARRAAATSPVVALRGEG